MNSIYKFLQRLSRFLLKLISIDYKKIHKFQNKNQVIYSHPISMLLTLSVWCEKFWEKK